MSGIRSGGRDSNPRTRFGRPALYLLSYIRKTSGARRDRTADAHGFNVPLYRSELPPRDVERAGRTPHLAPRQGPPVSPAPPSRGGRVDARRQIRHGCQVSIPTRRFWRPPSLPSVSRAAMLAESEGIEPSTPSLTQPLSRRCPRPCRTLSVKRKGRESNPHGHLSAPTRLATGRRHPVGWPFREGARRMTTNSARTHGRDAGASSATPSSAPPRQSAARSRAAAPSSAGAVHVPSCEPLSSEGRCRTSTARFRAERPTVGPRSEQPPVAFSLAYTRWCRTSIQ